MTGRESAEASGPAGGSPDDASGGGSGEASSELGARLARQERRLRLLLLHLAGPALRARVEIDDLLQEIYLRALGAAGLPDSGAGEGGAAGDPQLWRYLTRIARNTVVDAARAVRAAKRSGRTERLGHSDWSSAGMRASQLLARTWGPATRVVAGELEERLEARFRELSPEHRRVIGLRQFEGLSARETAHRMGRGEAAVHSLYRRALMAWQDGGEFSESRDESEAG